MVRISGDTSIARPPVVVFDVVADERNRYDPSIRHAELLTEGPIGVGTRFRSVSGSVRRAVEMAVEITGYDRPHRLASTTRTASMDIDSTLVFEPAGPGTRMHWSSQLRPRGFVKLLTPLLALIGRRRMRRVWHALKMHLEQQPEPTRPRQPT